MNKMSQTLPQETCIAYVLLLLQRCSIVGKYSYMSLASAAKTTNWPLKKKFQWQLNDKCLKNV
jgi:hypothetical protein